MPRDINQMTKEELLSVDLFTAEIVESILELRPFESDQELLAVRGIGSRTLERLLSYGFSVEAPDAPASEEAGVASEEEEARQPPFSDLLAKAPASKIAPQTIQLWGQLYQAPNKGFFVLRYPHSPYGVEVAAEDVQSYTSMESAEEAVVEVKVDAEAKIKQIVIDTEEEKREDEQMAGYGYWPYAAKWPAEQMYAAKWPVEVYAAKWPVEQAYAAKWAADQAYAAKGAAEQPWSYANRWPW